MDWTLVVGLLVVVGQLQQHWQGWYSNMRFSFLGYVRVHYLWEIVVVETGVVLSWAY